MSCNCCGHEKNKADEKPNLSPLFVRLFVSLVLITVFYYVPVPLYIELPIYIFAFLLAGYEVVLNAVRGIFKGKLFDENFLMSLACVAAFVIGDFTEAVAIVIFFGVGELFQGMAVEKSKANIVKLMDIRPDYVTLRKGKEIVQTSPIDIKVGDIIIVKPSERVALDGIVVKGDSFLDTKSITGEPVPRHVSIGDEILSGTINVESILEIQVMKVYGESTVAKILDLVQNASAKKSKSEKFITKFAKVYTPIVVLTAFVIAFVPPFCGLGSVNEWTYKAISFLVISCPCALVVSIPVGVFGGIGGAARNGILIKGGNHLETLNNTKTVAFDKTGTLTKGVFEVGEIITKGKTKEEIIELAAIAEQHSTHPIAKSILGFYGKPVTQDAEISEKSGMGIVAKFNNTTVHVGNQKLLAEIEIKDLQTYQQTAVYVAVNNKFAGCILISDKIKETTKPGLVALCAAGVNKTVMLTGDSNSAASDISKQLGITEYYANLLPQDKVVQFERIKKETSQKVSFVGDGMNDAPVLSIADLGIAMGGIGTDAAIETADIVLMNDDIGKIAVAKQIARKTRGIILQNICMALGVKAAVMALAILGITSIWFAIFADVGVALLAILNATRSLKHKSPRL